MRYRRFTALMFAWMAASSPSLGAPKEDLEATRQEMDASRTAAERLDGEARKVARELEQLQKSLVRSADIIQKTETELFALEEKNRILDEQLRERTEALATRKRELAAMVQAALRLSRTPPEAMVMMPGDATQTMKASRALQMTSETIKHDTEALRDQLAELAELKGKVEESRLQVMQRQAALDKERAALQARLSERKALHGSIQRKQQDEKQKIAQLAKKAEDLQSLLQALEKAEKEKRERQAIAERAAEKDLRGKTELQADMSRPSGQRGKLRSMGNAKGQMRPPVAGRVVKTFGAVGRNETSKGLAIATRESAQVVAPYDSEVVYAGNFLNYGRIVILRHSDDYHTLLAGLQKIDVSPGEFLLEGEPIGAMSDNAQENRLYVELRNHGQPINPGPWIRGLNKKNEE